MAKIAEHTDALAFFGTPFGGSDTTKWASFFERVSHLSHIGKWNKSLLEHLKTDSHELKTLGEDFPKWLNNPVGSRKKPVHVTCFYEDYPNKILGKHIVPADSARLPGHRDLSLPGDHASMCKFDNFEDPKHKIVSTVLKGWVDEIRAANKADPPPTVGLSCGRL